VRHRVGPDAEIREREPIAGAPEGEERLLELKGGTADAVAGADRAGALHDVRAPA
jgi:hypothetical protein